MLRFSSWRVEKYYAAGSIGKIEDLGCLEGVGEVGNAQYEEFQSIEGHQSSN